MSGIDRLALREGRPLAQTAAFSRCVTWLR
jgi:hypothetical protein